MSHDKNFDAWNFEKKRIDSLKPHTDFYIHEREVWWAAIGVNIGTEIDGKNQQYERPVLVLRKLGKEQFLGIPLTSKNKMGIFYTPIQYGEGNGTACISQIRVFSMQRLLRKIGKASTKDFEIITKQISKLITTGRV